MSDFDLERLEAWMQTVVLHPSDVEEAVASPEAEVLVPSADVATVIKTTRGLSPCDRLEIYHGMYPLRMREALESDYPTLLELRGGHAFSHLVEDYIAVHPSRSYTLNRLGDHLPGFLATWGPVKGRPLRRDLARLELAMTEVFDAEERAPLAPEALAAVPPDRWADARLTLIPALRLLSLTSPASRVLDALRAEQPLPPPRRTTERLVVYRRDYRIRRRELPAPAYLLLKGLHDGETLGESLSKVASRFGARTSAAAVGRWTSEWVEEGLVAAIDVP